MPGIGCHVVQRAVGGRERGTTWVDWRLEVGGGEVLDEGEVKGGVWSQALKVAEEDYEFAVYRAGELNRISPFRGSWF